MDNGGRKIIDFRIAGSNRVKLLGCKPRRAGIAGSNKVKLRNAACLEKWGQDFVPN